MGKVFGSSCLIAGTAIGAGMLALPMVLASFNLLHAIVLMLAVWLIAYYSALVGAELNLRAGTSLSLGELSSRFSTPLARWIGQSCFMILCYALLSAYLDGSSSIITSILKTAHNSSTLPDVKASLTGISAFFAIILLLSTRFIDYTNRLLFITMIILLVILMAILAGLINPTINFALLQRSENSLTLIKAVPVVFTSFGFQIIFHTISTYLDMDSAKIKRAFFWGSLLPAICYISWTVISLVFIASHEPETFLLLKEKSVDVGDFIAILSQASNIEILKILSWILSVLAILTSAIGVGIGLSQTWETLIGNRLLAVTLTITPPYIIAYKIPEAFIHALGFAGMILVVIALLLPLHLLYRSDYLDRTYYKILNNKILRGVMVLISLIIITIELLHIINWL